MIYVSNNVLLPDGNQNPFFLQDKAWLLERFGAFDVISPKGLYRCKDLGELRQYKKINRLCKAVSCVAGAFDPEIWKELFHMMKDKKCTVKNVLKLFRFSANTAKMRRILSKQMKRTNYADTVLYFYWLSFDAYATAKAKYSYHNVCTLVVRAIYRSNLMERQNKNI